MKFYVPDHTHVMHIQTRKQSISAPTSPSFPSQLPLPQAYPLLWLLTPFISFLRIPFKAKLQITSHLLKGFIFFKNLKFTTFCLSPLKCTCLPCPSFRPDPSFLGKQIFSFDSHYVNKAKKWQNGHLVHPFIYKVAFGISHVPGAVPGTRVTKAITILRWL